MKLVCDGCGTVEGVEIDGYDFGDTIVEGVMFIVTVTHDGKMLDAEMPLDGYTEQLNKPYWEDRCMDFVFDQVADDEPLGMCECGGEIRLDNSGND